MLRILESIGAGNKRVGRRVEAAAEGPWSVGQEVGTDMPNTEQKVVPNNSQTHTEKISPLSDFYV